MKTLWEQRKQLLEVTKCKKVGLDFSIIFFKNNQDSTYYSILFFGSTTNLVGG